MSSEESVATVVHHANEVKPLEQCVCYTFVVNLNMNARHSGQCGQRTVSRLSIIYIASLETPLLFREFMKKKIDFDR